MREIKKTPYKIRGFEIYHSFEEGMKRVEELHDTFKAEADKKTLDKMQRYETLFHLILCIIGSILFVALIIIIFKL